MTNKYLNYILNLLENPKSLFSTIIALTRGCYYIAWYKLIKKNVTIRFPFLCHSKVEIIGPGKVFIDRRCSVWMNTFEHLVIQTVSPFAEIRIGKNCTLGGLTIRCRNGIWIGDNVMTAANLVQDIPMISASAAMELKKSPITIGHNVWLGGQAIILYNTEIGDRSVAGSNALLYNTTVGEDYLCVGNPTLRPVPIKNILSLRKKINP